MKRIIIDCHNHTKGSRLDTSVKGSDGFDYVEDFAQIAKDKNMSLCAITEHDVVNRKLKQLLVNTEIIVPEAVEISAKNYKRNKSLHILYYAKHISKQVDDLLQEVVFKKKQMFELQIQKLQEKGFQITFDDVYKFMILNGNGEEAMNKWNISTFLFKGKFKEFNLKVLTKAFGKNKDHNWFYYNCMKSEGEFYNNYKIEAQYEPDLDEISRLAVKDNAILSIAHPNFTFKKGVEEFRKELPYYIDAGINAIEINTVADEERIKEIQKLKEKYDLILTFGSDCHKIGGIDDKHYDFGYSNGKISQEDLRENLEKFRKKIGI